MPINNKKKERTVAKKDVEILIAGPDVEVIQDCCSCIFDSECLEQDGASEIKSIFTFTLYLFRFSNFFFGEIHYTHIDEINFLFMYIFSLNF